MTLTVVRACGFEVGTHDGRAWFPLTPCCAMPVGWDLYCDGCGRHYPEGYSLGAIVGSEFVQRDCRTMIECLTRCETPSACASELVRSITP